MVCGRRGANISSHQPKWNNKERGTDPSPRPFDLPVLIIVAAQ
jgi:hypothetical protein